jgi:hypothetical protein
MQLENYFETEKPISRPRHQDTKKAAGMGLDLNINDSLGALVSWWLKRNFCLLLVNGFWGGAI